MGSTRRRGTAGTRRRPSPACSKQPECLCSTSWETTIWSNLDSRSTHVQSIHARRTTLGAFNFVGYQCSLPFMGGVFEKPEAGIETDLGSLEHLVDSQTVFVSHSPALGILDPGFGDSRIGSDALRRFLDRRQCLVHIHGHSHAGFGRVGQHLNVASGGARRAVPSISKPCSIRFLEWNRTSPKPKGGAHPSAARAIMSGRGRSGALDG